MQKLNILFPACFAELVVTRHHNWFISDGQNTNAALDTTLLHNYVFRTSLTISHDGYKNLKLKHSYNLVCLWLSVLHSFWISKPTTSRKMKQATELAALVQTYPVQRSLQCNAMHKRGLCHSAVSVRLSVTFVYCVETSEHILNFLHHRVGTSL